VKVTINVDGDEFDFASVTKATNRDAMALEDAIGVTYEMFMKRFGERFRQIGQAIAAAPKDENGQPILDDVDASISARDTTALVFLARRKAGESTLKFDDVEFELAQFAFGVEGEPDVPVEAPDAALAAADPTNGNAEALPTPTDVVSSPTV
jgi:hypothetical protein